MASISATNLANETLTFCTINFKVTTAPKNNVMTYAAMIPYWIVETLPPGHKTAIEEAGADKLIGARFNPGSTPTFTLRAPDTITKWLVANAGTLGDTDNGVVTAYVGEGSLDLTISAFDENTRKSTAKEDTGYWKGDIVIPQVELSMQGLAAKIKEALDRNNLRVIDSRPLPDKESGSFIDTFRVEFQPKPEFAGAADLVKCGRIPFGDNQYGKFMPWSALAKEYNLHTACCKILPAFATGTQPKDICHCDSATARSAKDIAAAQGAKAHKRSAFQQRMADAKKKAARPSARPSSSADSR